MPDTKNLDIFSMPLYYISFKKNKKIEDHYNYHGFKNVNHFKAIDGRKLDPKQLLKNGFITIRSYDDLMSGRAQHSGLPTLGAVGCTLSHYNLWRLCLEKNMPYIIITEEDNRMFNLDNADIRNIRSTLSKNKPLFISSNTKKMDHRNHFFGTNFYIASNEACKELVNKCFPMDVQTDWYMSNLSTIGDITLEGYKISSQNNQLGKSSIQAICITCILPKNKNFYFILLVFLLIIVFFVIFFWKKWKKCKKTCDI